MPVSWHQAPRDAAAAGSSSMLTAVPCSLLSCPLPKLAAVAHKNGSRLRWAEAAAGAAAATATAAAENENLTTAQRDALFVCAAATRRFPWPRCCLGCLAACVVVVVVATRRIAAAPPLLLPLGLASGLPFSSSAFSACSKLAADSRRQKLLLACRQAGWLAGTSPSPSLSLSHSSGLTAAAAAVLVFRTLCTRHGAATTTTAAAAAASIFA